MNIKSDNSLLWLEKKNFISRKRRTYILMTLCLIAGVGGSYFELTAYTQMVALTWIVMTIVSGNRVALSCFDGSSKYLIAYKGNLASIVIHKLYYPLVRMEVFLAVYSIVAYIAMTIRHQNEPFLLMRSIFCMVATPEMLLFMVVVFLKLRGLGRTFVNILSVVIFNVLFIAEQMNPKMYLAELVFLALLLFIGVQLSKKLTGETLTAKGVGR